jgi:hypothetical protein
MGRRLPAWPRQRRGHEDAVDRQDERANAGQDRGTVWQVIALDQLGADPADARVRAACGYVLDNALAASGGFGASGDRTADRPPPSAIINCLNDNLLRALLRS